MQQDLERTAAAAPRNGSKGAEIAAAKARAAGARTAAEAAEAPPAAPIEVLSALNIEVAAGELVALVGPVGCGKSSLLAAAWGECDVLRGTLRVAAGGAAMVPQKAFLIAGTISDNVLLGRPLIDAQLTLPSTRVRCERTSTLCRTGWPPRWASAASRSRAGSSSGSLWPALCTVSRRCSCSTIL